MSATDGGSGVRLPAPGGCRWCGVEEREHMQRWKPPVGWHKWEPPTLEQRKERMKARRRRPGTSGRSTAGFFEAIQRAA